MPLKSDLKQIVGQDVKPFISRHGACLKAAAIGLVVAIGSSGLFLGGITVAVSSLLVRSGMGLLGAMTVGFFTTGMGGILVGLTVSVAAIKAIARNAGQTA